MSQGSKGPIVGRFDRKRSEQWAYIYVIGLAMLAFLAWRQAEVHEILVGLIGCLVLMVFLHRGQRRIQNASAPQLVIDASGMLMPEYFVHRIPWDAIASARIVRTHERADMLVIDVPAAATYGPRERQWDRGLRQFADSTEFMIDIRDLDVSSLDIEAAIARFAPETTSRKA